MNDRTHPTNTPAWSDRRVTRRSILRIGLMAAAVAPLVSACGAAQGIWPGAGRQGPGTATSDRTLRVVQTRDFHPDHNAFVEQKIRDFTSERGYTLDHSYVEGYAGSGNIVQKLTAGVQAGDAPDVMTHTLRPAELRFLGIIDPIDELQESIIAENGDPLPAMKRLGYLDDQW
jgi:ABC-type glycerol-3-phosphate transport system substrate-binding protein